MAERISDIHSVAGPLQTMGRHSLKMSHKLEMNNWEWVNWDADWCTEVNQNVLYSVRSESTQFVVE